MRLVALLLLAVASGAAQPTTQPGERGFLCREVTVNDKTHRYVVYVPPSYDASKPIPLILYLHGSDVRGNDGLRQTEVGLGRAIRRNLDRVPAIVVFPQCERLGLWEGPMLDMAEACLQKTQAAYNTDPRRLYITGISMGGAATWEIAARMPDKVAAIAPICGYVVDSWRELPKPENVERIADKVAGIPCWMFHGAEDRAVMVEHSQQMNAALQKRKSMVTYTEYPEGKHNIWDRVYEQREFWAWLFTQKLPKQADDS